MKPASGKPSIESQREAAETRIGWKMAGIGMQVTSEVIAGALIGWLIDSWRGRGHVGVLIGSICGICVGLFTLIRQSLLLNKQLDRLAPTTGRGKPTPPPSDDPPDDTDALWTDDDDDDKWNDRDEQRAT